MARKDRSRKHNKSGNNRKRNRDTFTNRRDWKQEKIAPEIPVKKCKVPENKSVISSDSEEEKDPYNNLLSTFDVAAKENIIDTDESDVTDSEDLDGGVSEIISDVSDSANERDTEYRDDTVELTSEVEEEDDDDVKVEDVESQEEVDEEDSESESDNLSGNASDDNVNDIRPETVDDVLENDPFVKHCSYDLDECLLDTMQSSPIPYEVLHEYWPLLGSLKFFLPTVNKKDSVKVLKMISDNDTKYAPQGTVPTMIASVDLSKLYIKKQIHCNISLANAHNITEKDSILSPLQRELFSVANNYQDLYFPSRNFENAEEIRFVYTLHSVNHILKTRTKIVHHNAKLQRNRDDVPDEYRDQGLVRPKILIIVPFKDSAFRIVNIIMSLLHPNDKGHVINKSRFLEEYTGGEIAMPFKNPRPEDYEKTFCGNTDDNFKIGLSFTRKSLKLFVDFYSADIIIASPLGLRLVIGAEGEADRDYDFLASIEILIFDQTDLFMMQNWDHVLHIMNHLHLQPKESHGTDFARVRSWAINGWTRFYRQTLIFSSITLPEINSLFNKKCQNYAGKVRVEKLYERGSVCQVILQLSQVFHRFTATGGQTVIDARFDFFSKKILPQFSDVNTSHILVYVPSYFDYVRLRNYFKKEDLSFVQICEYSKDNKIARARDYFYNKEVNILLYSERAHFFRRYRIKGIRHLIFYQPPTFPHFYSELCNLMAVTGKNKALAMESHKSVTVMYAKSDALQLAAIVGTEKAARMLSSDRDVHMFVSGE